MTTPYATNKWVGLDIGGGSQYLNANMYKYLQANKWGLWLEGIEWNAGSQAQVISWIQTTLEPYLTAADSYGIPVRLDAKDYANSYVAGNYNQIFAYYLNNWVNGPKGSCLQQFWFEGAGLPALKNMKQSAGSVKVVWAWNQSWNDTEAELATFLPYCDIFDIEMWWVNDGPATPPYVTWLLTNFPNLKVGLDTQPSGGWADQFHLWGKVWDGSDAQPTYAQERVRCQTACNMVMAALGRKFDSLTAEVAGDSGDIGQAAHTAANGTVYPQGGWTEVQIMTEQLDWFDAQKWLKPSGGGTTTQLMAAKSGISNTAFGDTQVATTLTCVTPATGTIGTAISITGKLTRNDTGAGVAGQPIQLQLGGADVSGKTATTAADGTFTISYTETVVRTDAFDVTFAGAAV